MATTVILGGCRTPIGRLSGALRAFDATQLGGVAIKGALSRSGVLAEQIDYVYMGQALQAGGGQITARQAAVQAGIPMTVPATTTNKVCLSGTDALFHADLRVRYGIADIVIAGGMESMTGAPHLLQGLRFGLQLGDTVLKDSLLTDGLRCAFDQVAMGLAADRQARVDGISRQLMDEFSVRSHRRACIALECGRFAEETIDVSDPSGGARSSVLSSDEGLRADTNMESLAALAPAFGAGGSITAGNASQLSDGAAALVVASTETADRLGVAPLAEIVAHGHVAGPDASLLHQPAAAIGAALDVANMKLSDVDLFEVNEAFAAVAIAAQADLGLPHDALNVNGGAVALGHPLGMSGIRLVLTLALELRRRGGGVGAAALCGGGGQGDAVIIRTIA